MEQKPFLNYVKSKVTSTHSDCHHINTIIIHFTAIWPFLHELDYTYFKMITFLHAENISITNYYH